MVNITRVSICFMRTINVDGIVTSENQTDSTMMNRTGSFQTHRVLFRCKLFPRLQGAKFVQVVV